jgi:hypothetical protein
MSPSCAEWRRCTRVLGGYRTLRRLRGLIPRNQEADKQPDAPLLAQRRAE